MSREDVEQLVDRMLLTLKYAEEPEWNVLAEYIEELQQENQQLKDRINKAVEYIRKSDTLYEFKEDKSSVSIPNSIIVDDYKCRKELIDLLKGDKE